MKLEFKVIRDKNTFRIKKVRKHGSNNVWYPFKKNDQRLSRHLDLLETKILRKEFETSTTISLDLKLTDLKYYYDSEADKFWFYKKYLYPGNLLFKS